MVGRGTHKISLQPKKSLGGAADPQMCYLLERGMRTLHARMPIHASNAAELAMRLKDHPAITSVNHPSLPNDPDHDVASEWFQEEQECFLSRSKEVIRPL